jgi:DNA-binding PadR family transcriptional regulator
MYSITAAGEAYLDLWVKSLEQYRQNMDAFFDAYKKEERQRIGTAGDG